MMNYYTENRRVEERTTNFSPKVSIYENVLKEEKQKKAQSQKSCVFSTVAVLFGLTALACTIVFYIRVFNSIQEIQIHQQNLKEEQNKMKEYMNCSQNCYNGECVTAKNKFVCLCNTGYTGNNCTKRGPDLPITYPCQSADISQVVFIEFHGSKTEVYCEVEPNNGNKWLVFQRRIDGSVNFYQNWIFYQRGFGNKNGEFWLGLDILHVITRSQSYQMRIDLEDWDGNTAYAIYKTFRIDNPDSNYVLTVGQYSGTAGDSLSVHNNQQFSTRDRDHDTASHANCAVLYSGAWWYRGCYDSNLNGKYFRYRQNNSDGVVWYKWKGYNYSLKKAQMKIRPNANI